MGFKEQAERIEFASRMFSAAYCARKMQRGENLTDTEFECLFWFQRVLSTVDSTNPNPYKQVRIAPLIQRNLPSMFQATVLEYVCRSGKKFDPTRTYQWYAPQTTPTPIEAKDKLEFISCVADSLARVI